MIPPNPVLKWSDFTSKTSDQTLALLGTSLSGLSSAQIQDRRRRFGTNALPDKKTSVIFLLLRQLRSPFTILLLLAALVSGFLESPLDAAVIGVFLTANTLLGFYQEYSASQTIRKLARVLSHTAKVIRNGQTETIPHADLVPGDIVKLFPGDIAPADIRLLASENLCVDESTLTGESQTVAKSPQPISAGVDMFAAVNIVFASTVVTTGSGLGVVVATASASSLGQIAKSAESVDSPGALDKNLAVTSRAILIIVAVSICLLFMVSRLTHTQTSIIQMLSFSVALAVSVVPEALPTVITFALTSGAKRLSGLHVVVKKLSSIEDLGSISVLCTDKTGTLTKNELRLFDKLGPQASRAVYLASVFPSDPIDPFERAAGLAVTGTHPPLTLLHLQPFNPQTRVVEFTAEHGKRRLSVVRGAPEVVLSRCGIPDSELSTIHTWLNQVGKRGHRVLAVAEKSAASQHYSLLGILAFQDQIKPTTFKAMTDAKKLGVQVKIITGDTPQVAGFVGQQIGLVSDISQVISGADFDALDPEGQRKAAETYHIFARVSPDTKNRIISCLQTNHSVGFLGEGINDIIALKGADVGLVVDSASAVAKSAADAVLLKKDLHVIITAISEGRRIGENVKKYLVATLSANFGNFLALVYATVTATYLPMLPVQILLINLLSDFPMLSIAIDTVDASEISRPQKFDFKSLAYYAGFLGLISTGIDLAFFWLLKPFGPEILRTGWFIGSITTELLFLFSVRSRKFVAFSSRPPALILFLTGIAAILTWVIPQTSFGQSVFSFTRLPGFVFTLVASLCLVYVVVTELGKLAYRRLFSPSA